MYTASLDVRDGSPCILKNGAWIASFATVEMRDAVLQLLIERDELN